MAFKISQQKLVYTGIFVVGAVLIYMWMRMCPTATEGFKGADGGDFRMVMYGVDWCPHCVDAKPKFKALGPKVTIGGKVVVCEVINPEKEPDAVAGKEIRGYPTFHLYDAAGNLVQEYNGPRETKDFQAFLQKTVAA
jgi:thiol-disulfide isomerase/thioredoxin